MCTALYSIPKVAHNDDCGALTGISPRILCSLTMRIGTCILVVVVTMVYNTNNIIIQATCFLLNLLLSHLEKEVFRIQHNVRPLKGLKIQVFK